MIVTEQPLVRPTVRPKELAGTLPGQAASTFRKSKSKFIVDPAVSKVVEVGGPPKAQEVGEFGSATDTIWLLLKFQLARDCVGLTASYAFQVKVIL